MFGTVLSDVKRYFGFWTFWIEGFSPITGPKVSSTMASVCAVVGCGPGMGGSAAVRFARAGYKIAGMCRTADSFLPTEDGVANSTQSCKMCLGFCKTPIDGSQPHPRGDTFVKNRFCFVNTSLLFSLL